MTTIAYSEQIGRFRHQMSPILNLFEQPFMANANDPQMNNFVLGNPQQLPLSEIGDSLAYWTTPQNKDWYAYKMSETSSQERIAESLRDSHWLPFAAEDIAMTNGAFAGLTITLRAVAGAGDEVIFISPPWFFYEAIISSVNATPVRVRCNPETYDLDLAAIEAAITPRTKAIIVNSPNNPTGKIYPAKTLQKLSDLLRKASKKNNQPIYLLSDEAYNRIVYDNRDFPSPAQFYDHTFVIYTYGKTLLMPGQRLGYVAIHPHLPEREQFRTALFVAQMVTGYAFPNALLQHALADLDNLSINIGHLQRKRDRLVEALTKMGYQLHLPEGTFYLLVTSPMADDVAFINRLAAHNVLCLPGKVVEMPGTFRISLTASDEMIERALPGFAAALQESNPQPAYA